MSLKFRSRHHSADITLMPDTISFGVVRPGQTVRKEVTIKNRSAARLG